VLVLYLEGGVVVVEHVENLYNSLKHYIGVLEHTGSYSKNGTIAMLIYTFIVDAILEGPMQVYVDNKDLAILNKVFSCLSRNHCLISRILPDQRVSKPRQYYNPAEFRITQSFFPRITHDSDPRSTETNF
jgi:hypothetical protein